MPSENIQNVPKATLTALSSRISQLEVAANDAFRHYKNLNAELISTRVQYNSLVNHNAPVSGLPNEILATIFEFANYLPPSEPHASAGLPFSLVVSAVGRRWRNVAVNTPRLWSRIRVFRFPTDIVATFLTRSRTLPLDIRVEASGELWEDYQEVQRTLSLLRPHAARICHFWLAYPPAFIVDVLGHFSFLDGNVLKSFHFSMPSNYCETRDFFPHFRVSSALESLTFEITAGINDGFALPTDFPPRYPSLRSLTFKNVYIPADGCRMIMDAFPTVTHFTCVAPQMGAHGVGYDILNCLKDGKLPELKILALTQCRVDPVHDMLSSRIDANKPLLKLCLPRIFIHYTRADQIERLRGLVQLEEFRMSSGLP